jgi:hypothetical protein
MGVDNSLLALFGRAPPTSIYQLSGSELRTTGLVTSATPSAELAQSNLCATAKPAANCIGLEVRTAGP